MSRISATLSGLERTLLNRLAEARAGSAQSALRQASGSRIMSPRDNPTGFVALSNYRNRLTTVRAALSNVHQATSVVSQAQLSLDEIRAQLVSIRALAVADENQGLSAADRSANQQAIDAAVAEIDRLAGTEWLGRRLLDGSAHYSMAGLNGAQIRRVQVYSIGGAGPVVAAKPAQIDYTGSAGKIAAAATIRLTGSRGSTTLALSTDQSLKQVARTINGRSASTGITAQVDGDLLRLESTDTGSRALVDVEVLSGTFTTAGGDGSGRATGRDVAYGTQPAISGYVTRAATQATLSYTGAAGAISSNATIELSGNRGAATIAFTTADTLAQAADRINLESHITGVTASVNGNSLAFTSIDFGTKAELAIKTTSGTFAVSGGNGDGTAAGTNAAAVINGVFYEGNEAARPAEVIYTGIGAQVTADATFTLSGALGTQVVTVNQDDDLTAVRDAINAQSGVTGIEAVVEHNDLILRSTVKGSAGFVQVETTSGEFDVFAGEDMTYSRQQPAEQAELRHTASGGTITANATFTLTGTGSAVINLTAGQSLAVARDTINAQNATTGITASIDGDVLILRSDAAHSGAQVDVNVTAGSFAVTGGDGAGNDRGVNALTKVAGLDAVTDRNRVDGNRFQIDQGGFRYTLEFGSGFVGDFDTITFKDDAVQFSLSTDPGRLSPLSLPSVRPVHLGDLSGTLDQLMTGGLYAGLGANAPRAIRIIDEALGTIDRVKGQVDGFANAAVAASDSLLTSLESELEENIDQLDGVDDDEEALLQEKYNALVANAQAGLSMLNQQRQDMLALLRQIAGLG